MKKIFICIAVLVFSIFRTNAGEGMWLPNLVEKLNIADMHAEGFRLSAKDIYDLNSPSIKDAVGIFAAGCTAEIVSGSGLLLTNHHCGYGAIQSHSTIEHDYLKDGFWAETLADELPTPGLSVTFIREISDVTDRILKKVSEVTSENERNKQLNRNIDKIVAKFKRDKRNEGKDVQILPIFEGNQYLMVVTEAFNDVRLVGAPPSSIGKFGGEADNWMWPRHTGDFSLFRIYASPDNRAADYSPANVPYRPLKYLPISIKGIAEDDFTMILGFPVRTSRYMTTWEIDQLMELDNPIRIFIRGERQKLMWEDMLADDHVRIQYATKYVRSANYWKNAIGMNLGLRNLGVKSQKASDQEIFTGWLNADPSRKDKYGEGLRQIQTAVEGRRPFDSQKQYIREALQIGVESFNLADMADRLLDSGEEPEEIIGMLTELGEEFFKDYNRSTDRKISARMLQIYTDSIPPAKSPDFTEAVRGNIDQYVEDLTENSLFTDPDRYRSFVNDPALANDDPAMIAARSIARRLEDLDRASSPYDDMLSRGRRLWVGGLGEMEKGKAMYPDANFTMRLTYGQVLPYSPADAVSYGYLTTLDGVMEKENPEDPEFIVPEKLRELYRTKDYGRYGVQGKMPVNFITNNDITGGNSGSPVLNAKGELTGIAFDGNWEALTGNIAYNPGLQRAIAVDIRYVLLIIDKFAGAHRLIDEMTIVE